MRSRRRLSGLALLLAIGGGAAFLWLTAPIRVDPALIAGLDGDPARGARIFDLGGCASCHAAPGAKGEARFVLSGGRVFATPFGTFRAPNISSGPAGVGGWSALDLADAMLMGVAPDGSHYYPAFPYASYARMRAGDIVDLKAFMDTLPASDAPSAGHDLSFPFNIRRGLGLWKLVNLDPAPVAELSDGEGGDDDGGGGGEAAARGRYLVEGPGHCAECHTARDVAGGLDASRWLAGGPNPDGEGRIPNLTPHETGLTWSAADIAEYLKSGFTPDYDVVGGSMAEVVRNTARLTDRDRADIAAYLKALPQVATRK